MDRDLASASPRSCFTSLQILNRMHLGFDDDTEDMLLYKNRGKGMASYVKNTGGL